MAVSRNAVVGVFGVIMGSGRRLAFEAFKRYVRGGLDDGRRFELLGEGPGGVPLWIVNIFFGGVMKQMRLPTSYSRRLLGVWSCRETLCLPLHLTSL